MLAPSKPRIAAAVGEPELLEDFLDRLREAGQHEIFLVGARALSGALSLEQAGAAYADVAEAVIRLALAEVERRFVVEHGRVPGGRMAVLGMGRLGSREMTATSDLDLVVLYDFDDDHPESDGARPLQRRRLLRPAHAAPDQRADGADPHAAPLRRRHAASPLRQQGTGGDAVQGLRLLPAGRGGDVGAHGARARQTGGRGRQPDRRCGRRDPAGADEACATPRAFASDAHEMRRLIAQEKGEGDPWELKLAAGGLLDIEFIAQTLVLIHAHEHPDIIADNTGEVLARAAAPRPARAQ